MIEVELEDPAWSRDLPDTEHRATVAAEAALKAGAARPDAVVTVLLSGDAEVADLNQRFRHKAGPTNVLSFPAAETAWPHLGDLALAHGVCAREAEAQGKPLADHLAHLVAHGTLHLLGWDHRTDDEAEAMEALERQVLAALGIPDPYATRCESDAERRPK
ncbi:MAG TPA: rRNA maturation RNase YbeY [Caulobacteraceae bacterium]|jgi:probable rRNA maturation factor